MRLAPRTRIRKEEERSWFMATPFITTLHYRQTETMRRELYPVPASHLAVIPPPPRRFCPILICSDLFPCGTGIHSLPLWHPSPPRSSATCPSAIMISASASLALSFIFQSYTLRFLQNVPEHNHGYSTYVHSGTAHKITTRIICLPFCEQSSDIYL